MPATGRSRDPWWDRRCCHRTSWGRIRRDRAHRARVLQSQHRQVPPATKTNLAAEHLGTRKRGGPTGEQDGEKKTKGTSQANIANKPTAHHRRLQHDQDLAPRSESRGSQNPGQGRAENPAMKPPKNPSTRIRGCPSPGYRSSHPKNAAATSALGNSPRMAIWKNSRNGSSAPLRPGKRATRGTRVPRFPVGHCQNIAQHVQNTVRRHDLRQGVSGDGNRDLWLDFPLPSASRTSVFSKTSDIGLQDLFLPSETASFGKRWNSEVRMALFQPLDAPRSRTLVRLRLHSIRGFLPGVLGGIDRPPGVARHLQPPPCSIDDSPPPPSGIASRAHRCVL